EVRTVALQLVRTYTADLGHVLHGGGTQTQHVDQGGVGEYHIGRNAMGLGQALAQRPQLLPEGTIGLGNHRLVASAGRQWCGSGDIPAQGQGLLATQQRTAALREPEAAEAVEIDLYQPAGDQLTEYRTPLLLAQLLADPVGGQVL